MFWALGQTIPNKSQRPTHTCMYIWKGGGTLVPPCYFKWSEANLKSWAISILLKQLGRGKRRTTRALARLAEAGPMDAHARHACEWSGGGANGRTCTTCAWMVRRFPASTLAGAQLPFATWEFCMHGGDCVGLFGKQLFLYYGKCVNDVKFP